MISGLIEKSRKRDCGREVEIEREKEDIEKKDL